MNSQDLISLFFGIQNQLQVFHWQTTSFAQHEAFGKIYESFGALIDEFVEVYQGKYDRITLNGSLSVDVVNIGDSEVNGMVDDCIDLLTNEVTAMLDEKDTDLFNLRDEMLALLNKLKYLLTLK